MILLFTQLALGACVPDGVEVWPPDNATDVPVNPSIQVRITGDCAPETLIVELDGVASAPAPRFGFGPSLYVVLDLPDLEPGEHELLVRDEAPAFRVRSTFTVVDAEAEPPEREPRPGDFTAVWYETADGDFAITGFAHPETFDLHEPHDLVLLRGAGDWRDALSLDYVDPSRRGHEVLLFGRADEPPEEDVCIELVRVNASTTTTSSIACTTVTEDDSGRGCTTLSTAPAGLLALFGGLLVIARRRS